MDIAVRIPDTTILYKEGDKFFLVFFGLSDIAGTAGIVLYEKGPFFCIGSQHGYHTLAVGLGRCSESLGASELHRLAK